MTTLLVRNVSVADNKLWKGGHRLILGAISSPPTFPTKIEDVINLTTFVLQSGWTDFGPTTEDGFTISREWDEVDGVNLDQRDYAIRTGGITNVRMQGTATSLYTDVDTLVSTWALGASSANAGGGGVKAHIKANIGTISQLVTRQVCIVQQNDVTDEFRMFAFRKGRLVTPGELQLSSRNVAQNEFTLMFEPDASITNGSDFGVVFETTP